MGDIQVQCPPRYYTHEDMEAEGIHHVKMSVGGGGQVRKILHTGDHSTSQSAQIIAHIPFAELQIKPKSKSNQSKNLERLYNCLVVRLLATVRTVLMLLWPLKMLTNN